VPLQRWRGLPRLLHLICLSTHMWLSRKEFLEVIERVPLVSIDLVIRDPKNRILLGRRTNEPARGEWFVPGGRIYKDESLPIAFQRICRDEIKEEHSQGEARFVGCFTNKYRTNRYLEPGITTHYVVLAYELRLTDKFKLPEAEQHTEFRWFTQEKADPHLSKEADPDVNEYVLPYFRDSSGMRVAQYQALNARRDVFNNLLWQTPVISLTAQAFLFTIILSKDGTEPGRTIACFLSLTSALASLHLLAKHRFLETQHAVLLHAYEDARRWYAANRIFKPANVTLRVKAYWVWRILLWAFFIAAALSLQMSLIGLL
jgi:colanic acid biosynthesis protein WcaH